MLHIMRTHKFFSYLLIAIIFAITISFVFWGIGPNRSSTSLVIAQVEGEEILVDEFLKAYDKEYKRVREIYTNEEDIKKLNLKENVLNALVDRKVILIAADKAGITVKDEELQEEIMKLPYFQRDGVFNSDVYVKALKLNRMTPKIFEREFKNDIIYTKMSRIIRESVELSTEELKTIDSLKDSNGQLAEAFFSSKNNQAIRVYADSIKRRFDIRIYRDLLS